MSAATLHFDAWLRPHRSLTRRGIAMVLALAAVPSFILGCVFLAMGAWPVTGFLGLDVVLVERGFVPESKKNAYGAPPSGTVTLVGHLHAPQSRNLFTPGDTPAQRITRISISSHS